MAPSRKKKISRSPRKAVSSRRPSPGPSTGTSLTPTQAGWGLVGAMVLTAAGILSLPNYRILLPPESFLFRFLTHPSLIFLGFFLLVWLFRSLPEPEPAGDKLPRQGAILWMALLTGLCWFTRFYHPEAPPPYVWDEHLINWGDIRNIIDFGYHPLIFFNSSRPPFFPYLTAFFWLIFPHASGVWIIRFTTGVIDLGNLWSFYILGKILRGRRMGLILATLWTLSQPDIFWSYCGYGMPALVFVCVWTLICFYRLMERLEGPRFVQLAVVLAFGDYVSGYFRPFTPAVLTLLLLWIFLRSRERLKGALYWALALGLWFFWVFLFLYKNSAMPAGPWSDWAAKPWSWTLVILVFLGFFAKTFFKPQKSGVQEGVVHWAAAAGLTVFLMGPMFLDPIYSSQASAQSMLHEKGISLLSWAAVHEVWLKILFFFRVIFLDVSGDVGIYPLHGRSFFESFPEFAMAVGLAYFLARPRWPKIFALLIVVVGIAPFLATRFSHTGRLFGAITPLLLMAGWGLDAWFDFFEAQVKNRSLQLGALIILLGFWAWGAGQGFGLCRDWLERPTSNNACIGTQVEKDWRDNRVVVAPHAPDFVGPTFAMLCDQKDAWLLNDPQPVYLEAGEKSKPIALLIYGEDRTLQDRVRSEFPQAQWQDVPNLNSPHFIERVLIPFESLAETPGKLFYVQRVPANYWRRRFYWADYPYGLARGVIGWEDRVPALNTFMPPRLNEHATAWVEGEMTAPAEGDYSFSMAAGMDTVLLQVDGRKVLDLKPGPNQALAGKKSLHLSLGSHTVSLKTTFRQVMSLPDIQVTAPGGAQWILGKAALDSQH